MKRIFTVALLSAIGFVGLSLFNYVYAWPLLFPLVGGIVAMVLHRMNSTNREYSYIAKSGFYAALLVIIICALAFFFFLKDDINQKANDIGFDGSNDPLQLTLIIVLILGALFYITFLLGTGIGAILSKKKD